MLSRLPVSFLQFAFVGVIGFAVDAMILQSLVSFTPAGPYMARVISYLGAATTTWWFNRWITFKSPTPEPAFKQWQKFLAANLFGALVNYGVYALLITFWPFAHAYPVMAVGFGSLGGLAVNFQMSRRFVFAP